MKQLLVASALVCATALNAFAVAAPRRDGAMVVHEWGTFTSFQDRDGATISGINVDDEPVPPFVHRQNGLPILTAGGFPARWSQGAPRCHADVTLRLETPVLYFYPPAGFSSDQPIDVEAKFTGGWLTEYFPYAVPELPGFPDALSLSAQGSLKWTGLRLLQEGSSKLPQTSEGVWLAPRNVQSAIVTTEGGEEAEKYLFYRGVAHLDAPLVVRQRDDKLTVALRDGETLLTQIPRSWLVRVLPDGRVWYRALATNEARNGRIELPVSFDEVGATHDGRDALRRELASALVAEGLFPDEAQAMLETWKLSYFASEGLRLFFLLPQAWTDSYLPLSISVPSDVTRVMMGRIELVSAHQRAVLGNLHGLPPEAIEQVPLYVRLLNETADLSEQEIKERQEKVFRLLQNFHQSHAEFYRAFDLEVPEALRLYDSLGRFRDALLGHEMRFAQDQATRLRLKQIIGTYSACVPPGLR
jgi:hypothetical protein